MRLNFSLCVGILLALSCSPSTGTDAGLIRDAGPSDGGRADAGVTDGGLVDAGATDAGRVDAGNTDAGSASCTPCVLSLDCPTGSLCMGGVTPTCAIDCSGGRACPGALTCQSIHSGMGPSLGENCTPTTDLCPGGSFDAGLTCSDTWAAYGANFFATECTGACHRHDTTWLTVEDVRRDADSIRLSVETGSMPQAGPLSITDQRRLMTWLACGAP